MKTLLQKDSQIPHTKRIVFLGDSITDNGLYIAFMDAYFMQHQPELELMFINLGVSSETVSGLTEVEHPWPRPCLHSRMKEALRESKPDWVVLCYGMNDGIYQPFSEERFQAYKDGMLAAVRLARQMAEKVIVMTPPPYDHEAKLRQMNFTDSNTDSYSWKYPYPSYNEILRQYANWIMTLGNNDEVDAAINIYDPLMKEWEILRTYNPEFVSGDGIHPAASGHWVMARTLLSRMFNVTLERTPEFAKTPASILWFELVLKRHRLLSAGWKEHVGHSNPDKADALPLYKAIEQADSLRSQIVEVTRFNVESLFMPYDMRESDWNGYVRTDFYVRGREAIVVAPKAAAPGRPWIWRTEFFDCFANADLALVERGWHIAYCRLSHMYGCDYALSHLDSFRVSVMEHFNLAAKPVLFGFSRGGLYAVRYAAAYSEHVAALYLDAPVLDIRSWPGGKGEGCGDPVNWAECLAIFNLSEEKAATYEIFPSSSVEKLVKAGIPIIQVAGDVDDVVPFSENGTKLDQLYRNLGGTIITILKQGIGHHPHSLENPEPIIDFIENLHIPI